MLKKIIKNKLVETKSNKKSLIVENRIIKTKFNFLFENSDINSPKKLNKFYILILAEMVDLHKKGYNSNLVKENVEGVFSILDNLYKESDNSAVEIFKQRGIQWIIENLSLGENSTLSQYIKDVLNKTELNEVARLFSDTDFLSSKIAQSIKENYLNDLDVDQEGGQFMEIVRGSFASVIKNSDIQTRLETNIKSIITPLIDNVQTKFEQLLSNMRSNLVSPQMDMQANDLLS